MAPRSSTYKKMDSANASIRKEPIMVRGSSSIKKPSSSQLQQHDRDALENIKNHDIVVAGAERHPSYYGPPKKQSSAGTSATQFPQDNTTPGKAQAEVLHGAAFVERQDTSDSATQKKKRSGCSTSSCAHNLAWLVVISVALTIAVNVVVNGYNIFATDDEDANNSKTAATTVVHDNSSSSSSEGKATTLTQEEELVVQKQSAEEAPPKSQRSEEQKDGPEEVDSTDDNVQTKIKVDKSSGTTSQVLAQLGAHNRGADPGITSGGVPQEANVNMPKEDEDGSEDSDKDEKEDEMNVVSDEERRDLFMGTDDLSEQDFQVSFQKLLSQGNGISPQSIGIASVDEVSQRTTSSHVVQQAGGEGMPCLVIIDGKTIDVTDWKPRHPGGPTVYRCGEDITAAFDGWHGTMELENQISKTDGHAKIVGPVVADDPPVKPGINANVSDMSTTINSVVSTAMPSSSESSSDSFLPPVDKQVHPGSGKEFKTLIYIDMKGGLDASALFVNVKNTEEIAVWCSKRQNVGAKEYCNPDNTLKTGALPSLSGTDDYLAMTDLLAPPAGSVEEKTSFKTLWNRQQMAIVPGVGRPDHVRSHFKASDSAAKGVADTDEVQTSHGWLGKSIFAYNRLYCPPGQVPEGTECRSRGNDQTGEISENDDDDVKEIDAISLRSAAAGAHALETSNALIDYAHLNHITGVSNVEALIDPQFAYDYVQSNLKSSSSSLSANGGAVGPGARRSLSLRGSQHDQKKVIVGPTSLKKQRRRTLSGTVTLGSSSTPSTPVAGVSACDDLHTTCAAAQEQDMTEEELWAEKDKDIRSLQMTSPVDDSSMMMAPETDSSSKMMPSTSTGRSSSYSATNAGLNQLLAKERIIFEGVGVLREKLHDYKQTLSQKCSQFPPIEEWANSKSDAEIGMQLRVIAILMINGVRPKVFQLRQTGYDTHKMLPKKLGANIGDLRTGISTFIKAAEACGFWDDVLISTYSEFGRRLADNGSGTDHGWATYSMIFGNKLSKQVLGHNWKTGSSEMQDIVPSYPDTYAPGSTAKGDLVMTTAFQTLDACLLDAMGLPPLPRLEMHVPSATFDACPDDMRLRDGLNRIPVYNQKLDNKLFNKMFNAKNAITGGSPSAGGVVSVLQRGNTEVGNYNGPHLSEALSRTEILHVSRRLGWSPKSLGLEDHFFGAANDAGAQGVVTLQEILMGGGVAGESLLRQGGLLSPQKTALPSPERPGRLTCEELNTRIWAMWPTKNDKPAKRSRRARWTQELNKMIYQDFLDTNDNPLRGRLSLFFLSHYATPLLQAGRNHHQMCNQYEQIRKYALGNYRKLAQLMFHDWALRKSLDHPNTRGKLKKEQKRCDTGPIENFAREWLERFTVGLGAHEEADIKRLAKGLLDCESPSPEGQIFTDTWIQATSTNKNDRYLKAWSVEHAKAVVDRSLDFRRHPSEPPAAAQYLCSRLYNEFGTLPQPPVGQLHAPEVLACAEHLYDHKYDISYALQHILTDKVYFKDTLGQKKRWPFAILLGATLDFELEFTDASSMAAQSSTTDGNAGLPTAALLPPAPQGNRPKTLSKAISGTGAKQHFRRLHAWTVQAGHEMWNPPDVSGWHLADIWSQNRISAVHKFLQKEVSIAKINRKVPFGKPRNADYATFNVDLDDFRSKDAFQQKFGHLKVNMMNSSDAPSKSPSVGGTWYSYSAKICGPDLFINEAAATGATGSASSHAVNIDELFDRTNPSMKWPAQRMRAWKQAAKNAVVNACQFLA